MAYSKDWEDDWPMKYEIPRVRPSRLVIPDTNVPAEATHNENLDKEGLFYSKIWKPILLLHFTSKFQY